MPFPSSPHWHPDQHRDRHVDLLGAERAGQPGNAGRPDTKGDSSRRRCPRTAEAGKAPSERSAPTPAFPAAGRREAGSTSVDDLPSAGPGPPPPRWQARAGGPGQSSTPARTPARRGLLGISAMCRSFPAGTSTVFEPRRATRPCSSRRARPPGRIWPAQASSRRSTRPSPWSAPESAPRPWPGRWPHPADGPSFGISPSGM